jgi:hypothetical protein
MSKEKKPVCVVDWKRMKFAIAGLIIASVILTFVFINYYAK